MNDHARYARQIMLPEIGVAGQRRLETARVLVVGAGGIGCPVLQYLAAAGVGELIIVDHDCVAAHNLHRQILFHETDPGLPKVAVATARLKALNEGVRVTPVHARFSVENARELLEQCDLVVDGSDNFATRYLVNDACVETGRPFVSGAVSRWSGQVSVFNLRRNGQPGPTYRCLFPESPPDGVAPRCGETGVMNVVPGLVGLMVASEAIKVLTGAGEPASGRLLIFDLLTNMWRSVSFEANERIIAETRVRDSAEYEALESCARRSEAMKEIGPKDLKRRLDAGEEIQLIDVREPSEREIVSIGGELVPLGQVPASLSRIPKTGEVVVYCKAGGRSGRAIEYLERECGYTNLINLNGGILRWIDEVDPTLPRY